MSRNLKLVAALIGAQALMVGTWFAVQRARSEKDTSTISRPSRTTRIDRPAPDLALRRLDGSGTRVSDFKERPTVLHFWATWCAPCREELPGLLALADDSTARILAVSVDREWSSVRRFFHDNPPPAVFLADGKVVEERFGVRHLPVTYILDDGGNLRLRLDGPRQWSRDALSSVLRDARPSLDH